MNCDKPINYKGFWLILLLSLALALMLSICGCAWEESIDPKIPRQPVNEKVRPFFNESEFSHGDFLMEIGKQVNHMESRGLRIYKIRIDMGRDMAGKYKIYTAWVYYD